MEALRPSETLVPTYQITGRHLPEGSNLHSVIYPSFGDTVN
jgi:hypothetical protein